MKLNLGSGEKRLSGYLNVDFRGGADFPWDLRQTPWPWTDGSSEEIVAHDLLEHFSHRLTERILQECWRVLIPGGLLDIQVPDFEHCSRVALGNPPYLCNRCGWEFSDAKKFACGNCGQSKFDAQLAAIQRLFGGQDYEGNWHHNSFTRDTLTGLLARNGFEKISFVERNENGETYWQNWNLRVKATRSEQLWEEQ